MSHEIDYLGEGPADDAIARKLIVTFGASPGISRRTPLAGSGKKSLDKRLSGINAGLTYSRRPILVLRDLDSDAKCASELVESLIVERHPCMLLRVCVRESEAWLLADAEAYAKYCGVAAAKIPQALDEEENPKQLILSWRSQSDPLARHFKKSSKSGVPEWAALAMWNAEFVEKMWSPVRAAKLGRSNSLCRTVNRIQDFLK